MSRVTSEDAELATKIKKTRTPARPPDRANLSWSARGGSSPGPKPSLTVDHIARAAIAVADAGGLAEVSMPRVAREVHVTTMALYRYFNSKAELIAVMMDAAGGPVPDLGLGIKRWRSRLREWSRRCSAIYRSHPWFLQAATAPQRIMGPNELGWLDAALRALGDAGLTGSEQYEAFLVLIGHVRSNAEFRALGARCPSDGAWVSAMEKTLARNRRLYPALVVAIDSGAFSDRREDGLEFGLECILNGIESLVRKRRR